MDDAEDKKGAKRAETYFCQCGKTYKHRQGLWKHQKTCKKVNNDSAQNNENNNELKMLTTLVMDVVKQNQELSQKNN